MITRLSDGQAVDEAAFENHYTAAVADTSVSITVKKIVNNTGSQSIGPEGFTFMLTDTDTRETVTAESDKNGQAAGLIGLGIAEKKRRDRK